MSDAWRLLSRDGLTIIVLAHILGACASSTRIQVQSLKETNGGRSLYFLVRQLAGEEGVVEGYEAAASRVFTAELSPDVRDRQVILPGTPLTVDINTEGGGDIALYFFFTEPGDRWWVTIDRERLPARIVIELGRREIERVRVRRR